MRDVVLADGTIAEVGMKVRKAEGCDDEWANHIETYATIEEVGGSGLYGWCTCSFPELVYTLYIGTRYLVAADAPIVAFDETEFLSLVGGEK